MGQKYLIDEETLTGLATAVRGQIGSTDSLSPNDMTNEVNNMINYYVYGDESTVGFSNTSSEITIDNIPYKLFFYDVNVPNFVKDSIGNDLNGLDGDIFEFYIDNVLVKKGNLLFHYEYMQGMPTTYKVLNNSTVVFRLPYYLVPEDGQTHYVKIVCTIPRANKDFEAISEREYPIPFYTAEERAADIASAESSGYTVIDETVTCPQTYSAIFEEALRNNID